MEKTRFPSMMTRGLLVLLLSSTATMAHAQAAQDSPSPDSNAVAAPPVGGDIIVTARQRNESLKDVPIAITAFNQQALQEKGLVTVSSIAQQTPGLQFDQGPSPADLRPSLRGIALIEGRSNVAIIVDGIDVTGITLNTNLGGGGAQTAASLMDLERVEVVKGPQSVYFGRSALAGAIQFVSRDPSFTFGGDVNGGFGSAGRQEITAHITGPILGDTVAGTLTGTYRHFDGYYRNPGNGQDLGGTETYGVGGAFIVKSGDYKANLHLSYLHEHDQPPAGYVMPRADTSVTGVNRIDASSFDESKIGISTNGDYIGNIANTYRAILKQTLGLGGGFTLTSLTGYNRVKSDITFDFDTKPDNVPSGTALAGGLLNCLPGKCVGIFDFNTDLQQISQEIRLNYDAGPFRALVGGYYFDESYKELDYSRFVGAQSFVTGTRANIPGRPSLQNTHTYSGFGSLEYDILPALTATGEIRFNHEVIDVAAATGYNLLFSSGSSAITFTGKQSFDSWLPRFSLRYKLDDTTNVYASIAKGAKPGGFNTGQVRDDLRPFKQESIWTYEIGLKGRFFGNMLSVDASLYYSDWRNVQVTTICYGTASPFGPEAACPTATAVSLNYIINAKRAEVKGAELNASLRPVEGLTINAAYAYTDSKFVDFQARDVFPAPASPNLRQFGGNSMPLIPRHSVSGSVRYEGQIASDGLRGYIEWDTRYRSSRFSRFDNRVLLAPKTVSDAQIGIKGKTWSAELFVNNIFNDLTPDFTRYYGNFNPSIPNGEYIAAPAKRDYGIRLSKSF